MNQQTRPKAISLLSGGIDSTTATAIAMADGYDVTAISFDYGQRHFVELIAAKKIAASLKLAEHITFPLDLDLAGGGLGAVDAAGCGAGADLDNSGGVSVLAASDRIQSAGGAGSGQNLNPQPCVFAVCADTAP